MAADPFFLSLSFSLVFKVEDHAKSFFRSLKGKRGADAVHWKVGVWWDLDKTYYEAWVTDYNRWATPQHRNSAILSPIIH